MVKIVLSFDDGRKDNIRVIQEILAPLQIPATINITTQYIESSNCKVLPCLNTSMTKQEVVELSENPLIEIAGHGKEHHNEINNLLEGVTVLREWCHIGDIGIASPYSGLSLDEINNIRNIILKNNIKYVRVGDRINNLIFLKKCIRKINTYIHSKFLYRWIYKDTMLRKEDNFILYSVPVLKSTSLKELKYLISEAVKKNKSLILMFHSIKKKGEEFYDDRWTWDYDNFCVLCKYLKKLENIGEIKLTKSIDLNN